jgi:hypothetical protein
MAGGEAEATIVTKVVKDILGDAAEGVEKDLARDGAESAAKRGAEEAAEAGADAAKDGAESAGKDAARDSGKPLKDGETGTRPMPRRPPRTRSTS